MKYYDFAVKITKEAGKMLLRAEKSGFKTMNKGNDPRDIVTSVDKLLSEFLINRIKKEYPEHGIYSEEDYDADTGGDYRWVIDPIDGSANFSRGIPHFAVCVGLLFRGMPVVGAVFNPATGELFSFEKGGGAFLNSTPIQVSEIARLSESHIFFHAGREKGLRNWGGESYRRLLEHAKKTSNFSSSSLDACFVAAGRIEANIYGTLSTLDIASALGILMEAGGITVDGKGKRVVFSREPRKIIMANNKKTINSLLKIL